MQGEDERRCIDCGQSVAHSVVRCGTCTTAWDELSRKLNGSDMYKILILDDKALEDLKVAILEDAQNRKDGQSMSDLNAVVGDWLKLQPEVTRWSVRGNGRRTLI